MASEPRLRVWNLAAIFGAILEYVRDGGGFGMRSRRTEDDDLVITMRVEEPDSLFPRISDRLARVMRRRRGV